MVLSKSTLLSGRYAIQSVLGEAGPFDITYLGWDIEAEDEVVIREYFPLNYARRARNGISLEVLDARSFEFGLSTYGREGELLGEFDHPSVVGGVCVFKENGTIYRVSRHITGASLGAYIKRQGGALDQTDAFQLLKPLLEALKKAHRHHLYHGGLSPKSIIITESGEPMLLNFQMARTNLAYRSDSLRDILVPGFYPSDALNAEGFAAWDIYAFGALLYYVLAGRVLPQSTSIADHHQIRQAIKQDNPITPSVRRLLLDALTFEPEKRPANMASYYERFLETLTIPLLEPSEYSSTFEIGYSPGPIESKPLEDARESYQDYTFLDSESHSNQIKVPHSSEMNTKDKPLHDTPSETPVHRPDYLPRRAAETDPDLENMLFEMVKRQQYFLYSAIAIVLIVVGTVGGFLIVPRLVNSTSDQVPATASARVLTSGEATSAPIETQETEAETLPADTEEEPDQAPASELEVATTPEQEVSEVDASSSVEEASQPIAEPEPVRAERQPPPQPIIEEEPVRQQPASATRNVPEEAVVQSPDQNTADIETVDESLTRETEQQFRYLLGQGDTLYEQGQMREALSRYDSALALQPDDAGLLNRIEEIRTAVAEEERNLAIAESLKVRLARVTDANGIFIAPDTAPALLNETELNDDVNYPTAARRAGIEGRVIVRLVVDEAGRVQSPQVVQGIGFGCDEELIRVLEKARFEPGTFNQSAVKSWFMYSLVFSMN